MIVDRFASHARGLSAPADHAFAITPDDGTDLSYVTRALYVGSAGAVTVVMAEGTTITFSGLFAGQVLPVRVRRVLATGTTATALVGLV